MNPLFLRAWKLLSLPKRLQIAIMRVFQDEFLIGLTGVILNDKNEILVVKHTYRDGDSWSLQVGISKVKSTHEKDWPAK
jgi:8-oxo-dGTP diphosphatase